MPVNAPASFVPLDLMSGATPSKGVYVGLYTNDLRAQNLVKYADLVLPTQAGLQAEGPLDFEEDDGSDAVMKYFYFEPASFSLQADSEPFLIYGWYLAFAFDDGYVLVHVEKFDEPEEWSFMGDNTVIFPGCCIAIAANPSA